jgi:peptide/nickel transport system substrate-binding protein
MRRFRVPLIVITVALLGILLNGCRPAADVPAATPTPVAPAVGTPVEEVVSPTPDPAEARMGGHLNWGTASEPDTLDPHCTFSSIADIIYKPLFDTLVFWGDDLEFHPHLARSWEMSDDFTTITFQLRDDVAFHDGTSFNAEAVQINLDRIATVQQDICPTASVPQSRLGPTYESSEVIDDFTVRVRFSEPNPVVLIGLADIYFHSPAALEQYAGDVRRNPVGTGPFILESWVENSHLTVRRNPDYSWAPANAQHQGPTFLEQITWHFIPEASSRFAGLEAGELQLVNRIEADQYQLLIAAPQLEFVEAPTPEMPTSLFLNTTLPPLDDLRVRQALGHAIDRELALQTLFGGFFRVAHGPLSSFTWGYWPGVEQYNAYDPDRALALLEEAGWTERNRDGILVKDGQPLVLTLMDLPADDRQVAWEFFQAQLHEFGIQVDVEFAESGAVVDECHGGRRHICGLRWRLADPHRLVAVFGTDNIGTGFNWSHYSDERIDQLLLAGLAEPDRERRAEIYRELQQRIMDQALIIPIWETQMVHGHDPNLRDLVVLPNPEYVWLYEAYLADQ